MLEWVISGRWKTSKAIFSVTTMVGFWNKQKLLRRHHSTYCNYITPIIVLCYIRGKETREGKLRWSCKQNCPKLGLFVVNQTCIVKLIHSSLTRLLGITWLIPFSQARVDTSQLACQRKICAYTPKVNNFTLLQMAKTILPASPCLWDRRKAQFGSSADLGSDSTANG